MSVRQQSRVRDIHESVKVGRLYMIDLAGSERAKRTKVIALQLTEVTNLGAYLYCFGRLLLTQKTLLLRVVH